MFTATKTFALALLCITSATAAASIDGKTYECDGTISSVNGAVKCDGVPIERSRSLGMMAYRELVMDKKGK